MFSKTRERHRLEDDLLDRVQKAETKYRWTVAASKSLLASLLSAQPIDVEAAAAIERAAAAEQKALETYQRLLNMFTGLVVYGRMPPIHDRLELLLTRALGAATADMGILHIVNAKRGLILETHSGFGHPIHKSLQRVGAGECVCGEAFRTAQPVLVDDIERSPLLHGKHLRDVLLGAGVRTAMSTPILTPQRTVLGVISVYYRRVICPNPDQRMDIQRLAGEAGRIIKRPRKR